VRTGVEYAQHTYRIYAVRLKSETVAADDDDKLPYNGVLKMEIQCL
jgi:hypothetical protein